jgi:SAM-dependent MidA family methyltransferase
VTWIIEEIERRGGAISFRAFMELALYDPGHGYYASATPRYGRSGDFLTAPSASAWYARVFARMLRAFADVVGPIVLVDVGSGDGSFISGVIDSLGVDAGIVVNSLVTVERSQTMAGIQRDCLRSSGIRWRLVDEIASVEPTPLPAVVHASELYDALPVHRVVMAPDGLCELWVVVTTGGLEWQRRRARSELGSYLEEHGVVLQPGQIADLSLDWRTAHRSLLDQVSGNGLALVLDYGYPAHRLFDPRGRSGGSLSCYRGHRLSRDPLEDPGHTDITSHVNLDDLRSAAAGADWAEIGWWPLAEFLVKAGIDEEMHDRGVGIEAELNANTVTERQEIKRLLDPDGMGSDLKMLIQARGVMLDAARGLFRVGD